jgi:hypothetical protein
MHSNEHLKTHDDLGILLQMIIQYGHRQFPSPPLSPSSPALVL